MTDSTKAPVLKKRSAKKESGPRLNILLFILTLMTTWLAGFNGLTFEEAMTNGFIYMASVIGILLSHEMGHYIMGRINRVQVSLPYFIPFPLPPVGTFGAVIVMRGRIKSRNALMEVGAGGPIAGMIVAIPILLVGLSLSPVGLPPEGGLMEGQSLLYMLLKRIAVGPIPEGSDVILHPMAWAGWIGLLVTMLNLFPIGQLDGGHIFYALWGKAHIHASRFFHIGLFVLGLSVMAYWTFDAYNRGLVGDAFWTGVLTGTNWLVLGVLILIFSKKSRMGLAHPPTDDDSLSPVHRAIGIGCFVLLVLIFTPVPLRAII
ncbi:MAG: site-2 protease family protein [Proteobacteria bacterium]|nr:site-2 protease family protein [Pseudomonadota bacterium]